MNYLHEAVNYLHDTVNYLHDAVYYFTGDRYAWNSLWPIYMGSIDMGFYNAVFKKERLQCAWILMRRCIMLRKTGDFCEIHGSLSVEETMKTHIHMTSIYNGYTMKACVQSRFTMDMFHWAVLTAFYGQRKYFLDMRWIIIDVKLGTMNMVTWYTVHIKKAEFLICKNVDTVKRTPCFTLFTPKKLSRTGGGVG